MQAKTHTASLPPLVTLRRAVFGGYRRDDVEAALAEQRHQISALAWSLNRVWSERERLAEERSRFERELAAEREQSGRVERRARLTALHVIGRAQKEAARLRRDADARVAEASSRVEELLDVRENLLDELQAKVLAVADALARPEDLGASRAGVPTSPARNGRDLVTALFPLRRAAAFDFDRDVGLEPGEEATADQPLFRAAGH